MGEWDTYFPPVLRGKDSWKYLGDSQLTEEDYVLPDYISGRISKEAKSIVEHRIRQGQQIALIHNFRNKRMYSSSFQDIKHLGFWGSQGSPAINRFLSIYWMEKKGEDPSPFYEFTGGAAVKHLSTVPWIKVFTSTKG